MPYPELPAFVAELRRQPGLAARALELLILTAGRTGEVLGARREEIHLARALWVVPGERMVDVGGEGVAPLLAMFRVEPAGLVRGEVALCTGLAWTGKDGDKGLSA
jgi:integrase